MVGGLPHLHGADAYSGSGRASKASLASPFDSEAIENHKYLNKCMEKGTYSCFADESFNYNIKKCSQNLSSVAFETRLLQYMNRSKEAGVASRRASGGKIWKHIPKDDTELSAVFIETFEVSKSWWHWTSLFWLTS
eukprot:6492150-Amphidinium_carterae.1